MKDLIVTYFVATATHVLPLMFIIFCLLCVRPLPIFPNMARDVQPIHRRLRNLAVARLDQFIEIFGAGMKKYLVVYVITCLVFQLTNIGLIFIIQLFNISFPLVSNIIALQPLLLQLFQNMVIVFFWVLVGFAVIQFLPMFFLIPALFFDLPLPFLTSPPENRALTSIGIRQWERRSRAFATIRLTRFETWEKTFIYAKCRNDRLKTVFKLALCQAKEEGARTECYLYNDTDLTLEKITPAPFNVSELEELFSPHNE